MTRDLDATHEPRLSAWVDSANGHLQFPIQNLPLGIFSPRGAHRRVGVAIGDAIVDLASLAQHLPSEIQPALESTTLNTLFARPKAQRVALRQKLSVLLSDPSWREAVEPALFRSSECDLHLPAAIGDYTDFYVGIHHATAVGTLFRPDNPLLPNYKWVPIGYHGRASSVRVSGEPVRRPVGQRKDVGSEVPKVGPSTRLDYELELGLWVGEGNAFGTPIPIADAIDHVAGVSLLNDWSARDIQSWEYQPLGPFLSKNFHTSVSPWVVTTEALAPFRIAQPSRPEGDPEPLSYLNDAGDQQGGAFAIELEVHIASQLMRERNIEPLRLARASASHMYWTAAQIVAHHTSNGCNLQSGDLLGTGTISGPGRDQRGSLLELSEGGRNPIILPTGEERRFLENGDELTLSATARADNAVSIGLGACVAQILPALA